MTVPKKKPRAPKLTDDQRIQKLRDSVHKKMFTALDKIGDNFDPVGLQNTVTKMLIKERRDIVLKLIGMRDDYGKLEVDRCNSRDDNSQIGQYIRTHAQTALTAWLDKDLKPFLVAAIDPMLKDPALTKSCVKHFKDTFQWKVERHMAELAETAAREYAQGEVNKMVAKLSLKQDET